MTRHPKVLIGGLSAAVFAIGLALFLAGHYAPVTAQAIFAGESSKLTLKEPLTLSFNFPVNRRALKLTISPEVEGSWSWEGDVAGHLARTAIFTPETVWAPDQEYKVVLESVGPLLAQSPTQTIELAATTLPLPTIVSASVSEGASDVPTDSTIGLALDQPITDEVDFSFRLEPEVAVTIEHDTINNQYLIKPTQPLAIGQSYKLIAEREVVFRPQSSGTILSRSNREKIFERLFTVKTPPNISSFHPTGESVSPTQRLIEIKFSRPMDRASIDSVISLQPSLPGQWSWRDDNSLVFEATENLKLDTKYAVSFTDGGLDQAGDRFSATQISFQTAGTLRVVSTYPNKQSGVSRTASIRLTFDQDPSESSVAEKLTISPTTPIRFSRNGHILSITPIDGWAFNTTYTATLRAGAVGQYGRPSSGETIVRFTTEEKVVLLNIAWDRQDRALSCEAAALKMALAGKGVRVSEDEIMARVGYDPTARTSGGWGDPDSAFVGDINGAQNSTGYGVHWAPIARASSAWRPSRAVTGMSLSDAARELEAGNPIVIWGVMGTSYYDPWVTPTGRKVEAWKGEHARTLIGFRGSAENPTSFIINDPIAGRVSWSAAKLRSNWATFSNSGVIVY